MSLCRECNLIDTLQFDGHEQSFIICDTKDLNLRQTSYCNTEFIQAQQIKLPLR
jgi:hypothetical protein